MEQRFLRGSGCYDCTSCGRKTRAVDPTVASARHCAQCREIAGIGNSIRDGMPAAEAAPRLANLAAQIVAHGGRDPRDRLIPIQEDVANGISASTVAPFVKDW